MLVVPKAIADKPQAVTFYNMMDYKPNALLGIIIAITMIVFDTLIILILLIIKTYLSTQCVLITITTSTTIIIFAIKIKMSHPCLANHHHYHPGTSIFLILISKMCFFLAIHIHSYMPPNWLARRAIFRESIFAQNFVPICFFLRQMLSKWVAVNWKQIRAGAKKAGRCPGSGGVALTRAGWRGRSFRSAALT